MAKSKMYSESDWGRPAETLYDFVDTTALRAPEPYRSGIRQDAGRVLHSFAFRRLQGKTQVFPGAESDFFRTRLTHSLEVGQVAKSIAIRLNATAPELADPALHLEPDICEVAGWCHDLGHPPFGHNGEHALWKAMSEHGGFEGNAQTLRILARLEVCKGDPNVHALTPKEDRRVGLNLCFRTLAAVLKYDSKIPAGRQVSADVAKGYYESEETLVRAIKKAVVGDTRTRSFKTVECSIMDLADDIAYSTYDIEDAFHAGFLQPLDMLTPREDILNAVAANASKKLTTRTDEKDVVQVMERIFRGMLGGNAAEAYAASRLIARDEAARTRFSSYLVGRAIQAVALKFDEKRPPLSKAILDPDILLEIEILKQFAFHSLILAPELRTLKFHGELVVERIFDALRGDDTGRMLPLEYRTIFALSKGNKRAQQRILCDYVAGMTDEYAVEYYGRLYSETPVTVFKRLG